MRGARERERRRGRGGEKNQVFPFQINLAPGDSDTFLIPMQREDAAVRCVRCVLWEEVWRRYNFSVLTELALWQLYKDGAEILVGTFLSCLTSQPIDCASLSLMFIVVGFCSWELSPPHPYHQPWLLSHTHTHTRVQFDTQAVKVCFGVFFFFFLLSNVSLEIVCQCNRRDCSLLSL